MKIRNRSGRLSGTWLALAVLAVSVLTFVAAVPAASLKASAWDGSVPEATEADAQAVNGILYPVQDAWGHLHTAAYNPSLLPRQYDLTKFSHDGMNADYTGDPGYVALKGIDVSEFTGNIDWDKVKAAGYQFAIIRAGYSGFSAGRKRQDKKAVQNIVGAQKAGLQVGVYFFSMAVNEQEAAAEAQYTIGILQQAEAAGGSHLSLPVFYDPEFVYGRNTRNDGLSKAQMTADTVMFCETVKAVGYEAGVYANIDFENFFMDMSAIQNYHVWYADYEPLPQSPYAFEYYQYNSRGKIPGVPGYADMNLWLVPTAALQGAGQ